MTDDGTARRLLTRALHETLDAYVSPAVRQEILREALASSGLSGPPETTLQIEQFVFHGLKEVAGRRLGESIAEYIVDELSLSIAALQSTTNPAPARNSISTRPTPRATSIPPMAARIPKAARVPPISNLPAPRAKASSSDAPASRMPPPDGHVGQAAARPRSTTPSVPKRRTSVPGGRAGATTSSRPLGSATEPPLSGRRLTPRARDTRPSRPAPSHSVVPSNKSTSPPSSYERRNEQATSTGPQPSSRLSTDEYFRRVASGRTPNRSPLLGPVTVLALTRDEALLEALLGALSDGDRVRAIQSVFGLVRALDEHHGQRVYILFDAQRPSVRAEALAALADDLSKVTVVTCRTDPRVHEVFERISPATRAWVRLGQAWGPRDVATDCARLVS